MNEDYVFVRNPVGILYVPERVVLTEHDFRLSLANRYAFDGTKSVLVGPAWLHWANRQEVVKLVYEPAHQSGLISIEAPQDIEVFNLYQSPAIEPRRGDIRPYKSLLWHIFRSDSESREWFERWVAYALQNPGSKLYSAVVLWGAQHGAGKSPMGEVIGALYGENYYELSPNDLYSDFNDWAANRQFILANEIASSGRRKDADHLKTIITRQTATINIKYKQKYPVRDCINYFITSNHPDAVYLEDADRRFFVYEVKRALPEAQGEKIAHWINSFEGKAALLYHFLNEVNVDAFNPHGRAPITAAKRSMIEASRPELDTFVLEVIEEAMRGGPMKVAVEDLVFRFDPDGRKQATEKAMANALSKYGAVNQGSSAFQERRPVRGCGRLKQLWLSVFHQ